MQRSNSTIWCIYPKAGKGPRWTKPIFVFRITVLLIVFPKFDYFFGCSSNCSTEDLRLWNQTWHYAAGVAATGNRHFKDLFHEVDDLISTRPELNPIDRSPICTIFYPFHSKREKLIFAFHVCFFYLFFHLFLFYSICYSLMLKKLI